MITPNRRTSRLKLGQCEPFEQSLWRDDDSPHLIVDTRKSPDHFRNVAWSRNNQMIAAATTDGIMVWTLNPTAGLRIFKMESATLNVFSPDDRMLAGGSFNGMLTVWELGGGGCLWSNLAHDQGVASINFDLRGETIISIGNDGAIKVWSVSDGQLIREVPAANQEIDGCAVSADAQVVALGGEGGITLIDLRNGKRRRGKISDEAWINNAVFDATGRVLATGDSDGIVRLWNPQSAEEIRVVSTLFGDSTQEKESLTEPAGARDSSDPIKGNPSRTGPDFIWSLAFGRNNLLLAAGATDGSLAVWNVDDGSLLDLVTAHTYRVNAIAFNGDGSMLATCGGLDRIVKIWSVGRRLKELVTLIALGDDQWAAVTPDERFDASSGGLKYLHWTSGMRTVSAKQLIDLPPDPSLLPSLVTSRTRKRKTRARPISFPELPAPAIPTQDVQAPTPVLMVRTRPSHRVTSLAWSLDDSLIAAGTEDGNIDLWHRASGRELRSLRGHSDSITSLAFVGPTTLASGARDGTVRLWNILNGELLHTFPIGLSDEKSGVSLALIPKSGLLSCAGYDGTIRWLDLVTRTRVHTEHILLDRDGKTSPLLEQVVVSPDGSIMVRPYGGSVAVFDLPAKQLLYEFDSEDTPGQITFKRDGSHFAVGGATTQQTAILGGGKDARDPDYEPQTYAVDERLTKAGTLIDSHLGHRGNVVALDFSPDGASLATGSVDGSASIWRKGGGNERLKLETDSDAVRAVSFNRDGSLLATGESIGPFLGRISVWNAASGEREQTFERHIGDVHPVRFSPDGTLLAAAGEDGILRLWRLKLRTPPTLIKGHTGRIFSLAFSPDGQYIATASWDGTSRLWRTDTGELLWILDSREGVKLWSVAFNPDGLTMATGCDDGSVRVWEISSGNLLFTIEGSKGTR